MSFQTEIVELPKVELHQHVDGSIPVSETWRLMKQHRLNPVDTEEEMAKLLVMQPEDHGKGLLKYLDKFHYPLWVTQFYENLVEVSYAIAVSAYRFSNVRLLELRYAPTIHTYAGLTPRQAIVSVLEGLRKAEDACPGLKTGLTVIAMRHMGPHIAKILSRLAISEGEGYHNQVGVIGFDIAGAERGNPPRLFKESYDIARKGGLGLTAHAGEDEGPKSIWEAVDILGVNRIGHGCSAIQDETLLRRLARDKICVEVCITSNLQTGAVKPNEIHPLHKFLEYGIPVAICTDNTTVSNTDQNREASLTGLAVDQISAIYEASKAHSFIKLGRTAV